MKLVENVKNNKTNAYILKELKANSVYYTMVTAINKFGEGYRAKEPSLVITQDQSFESPSKLYVWGSNTFSELGLT